MHVKSVESSVFPFSHRKESNDRTTGIPDSLEFRHGFSRLFNDIDCSDRSFKCCFFSIYCFQDDFFDQYISFLRNQRVYYSKEVSQKNCCQEEVSEEEQ